MHITSLSIEKFRHLVNLEINIGAKLTAIAGQNGIGKSSLLGLLGHVCREKTGAKSLDDKIFETEYSEIFKLSFPTFDKAKEHDYQVNFSDGTFIKVLSTERRQRGSAVSLRFRTFKTENEEREEAKIDFPVLYLGLKRLFPIAQELTVSQERGNLTPDEIVFFIESHNSILLMDEDVTPIQTKTTNKGFYAATTAKYDSYGNSAGQDNVGQIISAIISFQRLKSELKQKYRGGLLLIDELDATLYSAAQLKMIEFLFKASSRLDLQIVFTTHSIEILEKLLTTEYKHQSVVCYLAKTHGSVVVKKDNQLEGIIDNLKVTITKKVKPKKQVDIYTEDNEAKLFLKNILVKENLEKSKLIKATLGGENLLDLANRKVPAFTTSLIVLDGDKKERVSRPHPPNVLTIPGNVRPEDIIFTFLKNLDVSDEFWHKVEGYTKQYCFKDQRNIGDRVAMKKWFNIQLEHWGKDGVRLFNYWKMKNSNEVEKFNNTYQKKISRILPI